ncbi:MAG: DNA translocase FtsK 4TM domain-containing protein [Dehalococcoidia bacterium]|nr:DNA translocase FtsK 4TM domain-containing protein [Dehalococcoidia bacterium]
MVDRFRAFAATRLGRRLLLFLAALLLLLVFAEAALDLLRTVVEALFQFFGLGVFIFNVIAIIVAWKIAAHGIKPLAQHWNRWAGAVAFTLAFLGLLAYASGEGTVFAPAPPGGYLGLAVRGPQPILGMVRVLAMVFIGLLLVAPHTTWRLTKLVLGRLRTELVALGQVIGDVLAAIARRTWRLARDLVTRTPAPARITPAEPAPAAVPTPAIKDEAPEEDARSAPPAPRARAARAAPPPQAPTPAPALALASSTIVKSKDLTAPTPGFGRWRLPALDLLERSNEAQANQEEQQRLARLIEESMASYNIEAKVVQINPGPTVTQFGVEPGWVRKFVKVQERDKDGRPRLDRSGQPIFRNDEVSRTRVKVESITALDKNLALALAAPSIRIEAPVPGKSIVGIEVPNPKMSPVSLRVLIESAAFQKMKQKTTLPIALGKGAGGEPLVTDLTKMPHCLVAGATGSGKSVFLHAIITCLLMHTTPEELRMVLVDPKRVEMMAYRGVPHLVTPVLVEPDKVVPYLKWATVEMENRYKKLEKSSARNIESYNQGTHGEKMPYLVIVIDELADLMMTAPGDVEFYLCRLAQKGRAVGIHLIVATQRPSVKVVTGQIKANFPTRVSFNVTSMVDSAVILDTVGAEKLLGRGDMLYLPSDAPMPRRLQGPYLSEQEVDKVVGHWRAQRGAAPVPELVVEDEEQHGADGEAHGAADPLFEKAKGLASQHSRISTSMLQRKMGIGYPRAARLMDQLEEKGIVAAGESGKSREVFSGKDASDVFEDTGEQAQVLPPLAPTTEDTKVQGRQA